VLGPPFPVVRDQLLGVTDFKGEVVVLAPHCQVSDLLLVGCLRKSTQCSKMYTCVLFIA
jgi:hypothetical protein